MKFGPPATAGSFFVRIPSVMLAILCETGSNWQIEQPASPEVTIEAVVTRNYQARETGQPERLTEQI